MTQALTHWLEALNFVNTKNIIYNPDRSLLVTAALRNNEGQLTHEGALGCDHNPIYRPFPG